MPPVPPTASQTPPLEHSCWLSQWSLKHGDLWFAGAVAGAVRDTLPGGQAGVPVLWKNNTHTRCYYRFRRCLRTTTPRPCRVMMATTQFVPNRHRLPGGHTLTHTHTHPTTCLPWPPFHPCCTCLAHLKRAMPHTHTRTLPTRTDRLTTHPAGVGWGGRMMRCTTWLPYAWPLPVVLILQVCGDGRRV